MVEDLPHEMQRLLEWIRSRNYEIDLRTNEKDATEALEAVVSGKQSYCLLLLDVMLSAMSFDDMDLLSEQQAALLPDPVEAGIRLSELARNRIPEKQLPIVAMSYRNPAAISPRFQELNIPFFPKTRDEDLRAHLATLLP